MKKGIWWLFGGIGLSAIVFAVLLATNVVSLHDNSSNDNSNNNSVSNEEVICKLNKKVDGVEYLFLVSKLEDLYYLNVYYIGDRAEDLLYRTDIEYSGECNEELTEYVSRKLINSDEEYNYYLYRYPSGPSFRLVLVASHKKYEYMYNMLELGYDHNDLVTKVQSGKKDYVLSEIVELDGNARISNGKLYFIDDRTQGGTVNIVDCDEVGVHEEYVFEFGNGTFTKQKSGDLYFSTQEKC